MNREYVYAKNLNRHLIHILDKNNRRQGVSSENLLFCVLLYIALVF